MGEFTFGQKAVGLHKDWYDKVSEESKLRIEKYANVVDITRDLIDSSEDPEEMRAGFRAIYEIQSNVCRMANQWKRDRETAAQKVAFDRFGESLKSDPKEKESLSERLERALKLEGASEEENPEDPAK